MKLEELFCKLYPEYSVNGKPLSPFFDLFERGYEEAENELKCCENCKYNSYWGNELHCNYGLKEALQEDKLVECNKMDKWEIKENDR